jgi:hypothetical protein
VAGHPVLRSYLPVSVRFFLSVATLLQGDIAEATAAAARSAALAPWNPEFQAQHAALLARSGDESAAERMLEKHGGILTAGQSGPGAMMSMATAAGIRIVEPTMPQPTTPIFTLDPRP